MSRRRFTIPQETTARWARLRRWGDRYFLLEILKVSGPTLDRILLGKCTRQEQVDAIDKFFDLREKQIEAIMTNNGTKKDT